MTMKNLTAKQEARLEKKKKKMAALTEIIKLNDRDGRKKTPSSPSHSEATNSSGDEEPKPQPLLIEDAKRPHSQPQPTAGTAHEPSRKRLKRTSESSADGPASGGVPAGQRPISAPDQKTATAPGATLDYAAMKRLLSARKRADRSVPKIRLKLWGECAQLSNAPADRTPIFLTDVQHLIMGTVLGSSSPCTPYRWCHIEKSAKVPHVVVLVVDGCSLDEFTANRSAFSFAGRTLRNKLEVIMPADGHVVEELVQVPLTDGQSDDLIDKYGSLEAAVESTRNQTLLVQTVFPVAGSGCESATIISPPSASKEVLPRTQLLLSALQLVDEGYPIPLHGELAARFKSYVLTKDTYAPVTASSPMFGLDCEMCRTSAGINELTRISIINERFESIYETMVRPENAIVDYLTKFSGITSEMMLNVTKTRTEVQHDVRALLPADAILVGQSLQSDLNAMQMMHPYVIDTSCIFNLSGERRMKSKLQALTLEFLGEVIQDNPLGHDSIEDCSASLKLAKLKLERGVDFGDAILRGRKRANEVQKQKTADAGDQPAAKRRKSTMVIASESTGVDYAEFVGSFRDLAQHQRKHIHCERADSNKATISRTRAVAIEHDLTISHVRVRLDAADGETNRTLSKVDRWMAKCWDCVAPNGLLVVMLGAGSADASAPTGGHGGGGGGDGCVPADDAGTAATTAATKPTTRSNHSGVVLFDIKPATAAMSTYASTCANV